MRPPRDGRRRVEWCVNNLILLISPELSLSVATLNTIITTPRASSQHDPNNISTQSIYCEWHKLFATPAFIVVTDSLIYMFCLKVRHDKDYKGRKILAIDKTYRAICFTHSKRRIYIFTISLSFSCGCLSRVRRDSWTVYLLVQKLCASSKWALQ